MATHAPHNGRASALPLSAVLRTIPSYPRPVIERLVARLIDHLDTRDGDPDLEEDDPSGGNADDEGEEEKWLMPAYGVDQSLGPVGRWGCPP